MKHLTIRSRLAMPGGLGCCFERRLPQLLTVVAVAALGVVVLVQSASGDIVSAPEPPPFPVTETTGDARFSSRDILYAAGGMLIVLEALFFAGLMRVRKRGGPE